eukprot:CAMPEP_0179247210 /NCGR_PEP_ID=MMETSP0797-20121207/19491_1 /TAXON_ID=47934 /ORGANISM="Dinophysis acuminata, Strain DAEP01" /LENGTH=340 /DNA_ID=CAMNT_0020954821 /DNA_START=46 /DNA_END=1067 /DNA_ORIENTATION=-
MAAGPFDFLKAAWGIELLPLAQEEIASYAESLTRKYIEEYIKDSDIRKFGVVSSLPKEITRSPDTTIPPGRYLVQVSKFADITQPTKFQEDFESGKWRLLTLDMSDGEQKFKGFEYSTVKDLTVQSPPGTKLLLWSSAQAPLCLKNGHLLLTPDNVEFLGGTVEKLVESWKASNEVEETRLLWRTMGEKKKKVDGGGGAPQWVDFDPKKAPRGPMAQRQADAERAEWRMGAADVPSGQQVQGGGGGDREGPRFSPEEFAAVGDAPPKVKNQVASDVFKEKDPRSGGKGKGKSKAKGGKGAPWATPWADPYWGYGGYMPWRPRFKGKGKYTPYDAGRPGAR